MADRERKYSLAITLRRREPLTRGELVEPSEELRVAKFYEKMVLTLRKWGSAAIEGKDRHSQEALIKEIEQEKALIFPTGLKEKNPTVDYNEDYVPGLWLGGLAEAGNKQLYLKPVLPVNHLLLASLDERATRGLFSRIPELLVLVKDSGLTEDEVLITIASAAFAALCTVEATICYSAIYDSESLAIAATGCLFAGPIIALERLELAIKELKNSIMRRGKSRTA